MGTRSIVAKKIENGFMAIYVHWDGYPDGVGAELVEDFNNEAGVDLLMDQGDSSTLTESYKSRGEDDVDATFVKGKLSDLRMYASRSGGEYVYVWDNGWQGYTTGGDEVSIPDNTKRKVVKTTQNEMVLEYLRGSNTLDDVEALELFGVMCLSARICELRKMGHDIETADFGGYSFYRLM